MSHHFEIFVHLLCKLVCLVVLWFAFPLKLPIFRQPIWLQSKDNVAICLCVGSYPQVSCFANITLHFGLPLQICKCSLPNIDLKQIWWYLHPLCFGQNCTLRRIEHVGNKFESELQKKYSWQQFKKYSWQHYKIQYQIQQIQLATIQEIQLATLQNTIQNTRNTASNNTKFRSMVSSYSWLNVHKTILHPFQQILQI